MLRYLIHTKSHFGGYWKKIPSKYLGGGGSILEKFLILYIVGYRNCKKNSDYFLEKKLGKYV